MSGDLADARHRDLLAASASAYLVRRGRRPLRARARRIAARLRTR